MWLLDGHTIYNAINITQKFLCSKDESKQPCLKYHLIRMWGGQGANTQKYFLIISSFSPKAKGKHIPRQFTL